MTYERLSEGQRVGEYALERLTLRSDHSETWSARHHLLDRRVTVVVAVDEKAMPGLQAMGVAQHGLEHPAIVRTLGLNLEKNPPYLVLEDVEGRTLREVLAADAPLPWSRAKTIVRGVLQALAHAHERDVVHGDLRPEVVWIDGEDNPRLTGFCRRAEARPVDDLLSDSLGEEEREAVRQAQYLPQDPEPITPAFDVYSVGVLLFEMLTGGLPAGSEVPSDIAPSASPGVDRLFRKAYTSINLRYGSAARMLEAAFEIAPPTAVVEESREPEKAEGIQILKSVRRCAKCGGENPMDFKFCMSCGSSLEGKAETCRICHKPLADHGRFCTFCGARQ